MKTPSFVKEGIQLGLIACHDIMTHEGEMLPDHSLEKIWHWVYPKLGKEIVP